MSSSLAANRLGFRPCANHSVGRRSPPAAVRLPAPCRRPRCRASASAAPAVEPAAPEAAAAAAAPAGELPHHRGYPHIDQRFPGLELVHAEPPVYLAHDFLSAEDCALLRSSAAAGELPSVEYENRVLADTNRLWPLALVVAAGAGFDCWQALACAAGVAGSSSIGSIAAVAGPSLLRWAAGVGGLLAAVLLGMQQLAGGSVFTGDCRLCLPKATQLCLPPLCRPTAHDEALLPHPPIHPPQAQSGQRQGCHLTTALPLHSPASWPAPAPCWAPSPASWSRPPSPATCPGSTSERTLMPGLTATPPGFSSFWRCATCTGGSCSSWPRPAWPVVLLLLCKRKV